MLNRFSRIISLKSFSDVKGVNILSVASDEATKNIDLAIGYFMVEQKITREQMANLMGISANTLRWKREGKTSWLWDEILLLSEIIGKSPDELAGINHLTPA